MASVATNMEITEDPDTDRDDRPTTAEIGFYENWNPEDRYEIYSGNDFYATATTIEGTRLAYETCCEDFPKAIVVIVDTWTKERDTFGY